MTEKAIRTDKKSITGTSLRLIPGEDRWEIRQCKAVNRLLEGLDKTAEALSDQLCTAEPLSRLLYTVQCTQAETELTLQVTLVHRVPGIPSRRKRIQYRFQDERLLSEIVV